MIAASPLLTYCFAACGALALATTPLWSHGRTGTTDNVKLAILRGIVLGALAIAGIASTVRYSN